MKIVFLCLAILCSFSGCVSSYSGCIGSSRIHVHEGISNTPNGIQFHKSVIIEH